MVIVGRATRIDRIASQAPPMRIGTIGDCDFKRELTWTMNMI